MYSRAIPLHRIGDFARPVTSGSLTATRAVAPHVAELALVGGAYLTYMLVRWWISGDISSVAFDNAERIVELERGLGVFWEPAWQRWTIDSADALVVFFNWTYIFTFYPIIVTASVIMYVKSRHRYRYYRNVVLLSFVFALAAFALFPLAPPRMLTGEFVDTVASFGPSFYASAEVADYYNAFAAMPSLHFGWSVLFGVVFFNTGSRVLRVLGIVYPSLMLFSIIVTGNHYFLDAVGGGVVIVGSFGAAHVARRIAWKRVRARRRSRTA